MKISRKNTILHGVYIFEYEVYRDLRGSFAPIWDAGSLEEELRLDWIPTNYCLSYNSAAETLRGIHYQIEPHGQAKMVSCAAGKIMDVVVDLRADSPSFLKVFTFELSADSGMSIFIPPGCAHGFVTLEMQTCVSYLIAGPYVPDASRTIRWNDPLFGIKWPFSSPIVSDRDRDAPLFRR